jgi:predicted nucleic acid-binding protein/Arc/MetJ-type ribon-helix-helix transcriptional regulator
MSITLTPELEDRIAANMQIGEYQSAAEVVQAGIDLLEAKASALQEMHKTAPVQDTRPIWEIAEAVMKEIPADAWDGVPTDLARNHKHYLYGAPREDLKDTSYWIAVVSPKDELHVRAAQVSGLHRDKRIVTSEWVLAELLNHFSERDLHIRFGVSRFVERLTANPAILLASFSEYSFKEAFDLYRERADKHWSLSDCSSIVIMRRLGIHPALTHDRHFEQAGFRALLRE